MTDRPAPKPYGEALTDLRALANRWALMARDHARESKTRTGEGDETKAAYYRGLAEAYYKLAMELADVVKTLPESAQAAPANAAAAPAPEKTLYAAVPIGEALRLLDYAGVSARDVKQHKDYVFSAVFSRWQPFSERERIDRMTSVDPRVIIVNHGLLPDTKDPYVDFAFRHTES